MERALGMLWMAFLTAGLASGCQSYATAPDTGVEEDGEPGPTDQLPGDPGWWPDRDWDDPPWPQEGDPFYGDCCGPGDGDPGWWPDSDPGQDGGDGPGPDCPDVSGEVWVAVDCGVQFVDHGLVFQNQCQVEILAGSFYCFGQVEPDGTLYVGCQDVGMTCRGQVHMPGMPFGLQCDVGCSAGVFPVQGECYDNDPCPVGTSCQVIVDAAGQSLETACWYGAGPGYDNTGQRCENDTECFSTWCLDQGFCAGTCLPDGGCPLVQTTRACAADADCQGLGRCVDAWCAVPSTCQTRLVPMGVDPQGNALFDWVNLCLPEGRACLRDADCRPGTVCRLQTALTTWPGFEARCGPPGPGDGDLGAPCAECRTNVCLAIGQDGVCSRLCVNDADCDTPPGGGRCEDAQVWLLPGWSVGVQACVLR